MKQLCVDIHEITPKSKRLAREALVKELKRRRIKRSIAGPLPAGDMVRCAKVFTSGPYSLRYIEAVAWTRTMPPRIFGRFDTLYGK